MEYLEQMEDTMATMDPVAAMQHRALVKASVPTKPTFLPCWVEYKKLMLISDRSLLAAQHQKAYPRYATTLLRCATKDDLNSYTDKWESYDRNTQIGSYKSVWVEEGKHGWVHGWYEALPEHAKNHVVSVPGAFPIGRGRLGF